MLFSEVYACSVCSKKYELCCKKYELCSVICSARYGYAVYTLCACSALRWEVRAVQCSTRSRAHACTSSKQ